MLIYQKLLNSPLSWLLHVMLLPAAHESWNLIPISDTLGDDIFGSQRSISSQVRRGVLQAGTRKGSDGPLIHSHQLLFCSLSQEADPAGCFRGPLAQGSWLRVATGRCWGWVWPMGDARLGMANERC